MQPDPKAVWSDSVGAEVGYWYRTMKKDPAAFARRYRRPSPSNQMLPGFVDLFGSGKVSLLDVGSGPAPVVIGGYSTEVEIVACDPLADRYQELLDRHGIQTPVRLLTVDGERLVEHFGEDRFDICHIQNALDHSYQPVEIVRNMLRCARPGGLVLIRTVIDEGANEDYRGLHQWDISPGAGDFYIRHRDGEVTAVRKALGDQVALLMVGTHSSLPGAKLQDWMDVVLVKKGAGPEFLRDAERHFFRVQVELGQHRASGAGDGQVGRLRGQVEALQARVRSLEQSTAYRLGAMLLRARRSPARLAALPRDLLRLRRGARGGSRPGRA
jgi:SAM-dependent methyltransferase